MSQLIEIGDGYFLNLDDVSQIYKYPTHSRVSMKGGKDTQDLTSKQMKIVEEHIKTQENHFKLQDELIKKKLEYMETKLEREKYALLKEKLTFENMIKYAPDSLAFKTSEPI